MKKKRTIKIITPPLGFSYFPNFITPEKQQQLLEEIRKLCWQDVVMHGVTARRKVVHYGFDYTYDTRSITPTDSAPGFLNNLLEKAKTLVDDVAIDEVLITHYPVGAGINWHRDAPPFDKVIGISLGKSCTLKLRRIHRDFYEVFSEKIEPGSAYLLAGSARTVWQHSIPPVREERYSITLRTLRK